MHFKTRSARRITQALFLLLFLFLFLQTESKGADDLGWPVRFFLDFDPLVLLTSFLAGHVLMPAFLLSLVLVALTAVLGRVFCGWVCPLGTLNNIVSVFRKKKNRPPHKWFGLKYYILISVIASSAFGLQVTGFLDPISLLVRSLAVSIYPAFNLIRAPLESLAATGLPLLAPLSEGAVSFLKGTVLSFQQPYFYQSFLIGLVFLVILTLNFVDSRFWCKFLCPLGALLGLLSRFSFLRRETAEGCTECGKCSGFCQGGTLPPAAGGECLQCFNCDDLCPPKISRAGFGTGRIILPDLKRRRLIISAVAGAIAVPFLKISPFSKPDHSESSLIRPPGALPEDEFLARCIRCGECLKVCITNGLQPALGEGGIEGLWTPILVPAAGYCELRCTLCGQVCPTGAIQKLKPDDKPLVKIGLAMIDRSRCLPYAHSTRCIVCEEVCPLPKKAIWFEKARVKNRGGKLIEVKQPNVDLELCNGCGICEAKCPVLGQPAIKVTSLGESRSKSNQILLNS